MAVKQNNAEANANASPMLGANTTSSSSSSSNLASGSSNNIIATGVVGFTNGTNGGTGGVGGVKSKINAIDQVDGSGNINSDVNTINEQCGVGLCQQKPIINNKINNHHQDNDNDNYDFSDGLAKSPKDLSQILHIIEILQYQQQELSLSYEVLVPIYEHILKELSHIEYPRSPPEVRQRFCEDIARIGEFFGKPNEKKIYLFYLHVIWELITKSIDRPSCTLTIIFGLFDSDMIVGAVQQLLEHKISEASIRHTVRLLCNWLSNSIFCQNIHIWIVEILGVIKDQQKWSLLEEIVYDNVEQAFSNLIVPCLRQKVLPLCFFFLSTISQTPRVFHKIVPRIPKVFRCLKQQFDTHDDAKPTMQKMGTLIMALIAHFAGYDELYQPVVEVFREFDLSDEKTRNNDLENLAQLENNAKAGLVNLGNTCYMNSVLQALANTQEFSRDILLCKSTSPLIMRMQEQIALMLYSYRNELTPSRVLGVCRPPSFVAGLQQDSSEFLSYLLETLHVQETNFRTNDSNKMIPQKQQYNSSAAIANHNADNGGDGDAKGIDDNVTHKSNVAIASIAPANLSTIEKTFTGKQATTYRCLTCGFKSLNVDIFRDLQLSFPELKNDCASNYSVQDLLDFYCSPEKLDGENQYFCERCQRLTDGERSVRVISAPKNLIITLKHFKYDHKYHTRAKLMHKVFHDEKVYVKVCAAESLEEIASAHYDLYASVVHSGYSMDSGHYYTYAADALNRWYKFNDNIVTPSKAEELHNLSQPNTPYILFYQLAARSNECSDALMVETGNESATCTPNVQVVKIEMPLPLKLDELPYFLRDYVNRDNNAYNEELKQRRMKNITNGSNHVYTIRSIRRHDSSDDEDDSSPTSRNGGSGGGGGGGGGGGVGCGGNALSFNVNRFVC